MKERRPTRRFFAESLAGDAVELPPAEAHHALHVLRLTEGEQVEVFDGRGAVAAGMLVPAGRKGARVEIRRRMPPATPPAPAVKLAFAAPKGRRLDWLLEKCTELAASALAPVVFERSVARTEWSERTRQRWRAACIAAAKQSGAAFLPAVTPPMPLAAYLRDTREGLRVFGDPDGAASLPEVLGTADRRERLVILIGPEGGLTPAERRATEDAAFRPVRLGGQTLRVETAAVAFLAVVRACCGS